MKNIVENPIRVLSQKTHPVKINGIFSSVEDKMELTIRLLDGRESIRFCKFCKDGYYHINTY